ncbi:uncharacterized protein LOC130622327 [Hydractinia symbiolongicarpus]|uniref:uncharacterized protein LOC130622327 n=1 Tax=Hydractinia symbiolongicarpus TaxID=13093 RepID=UPI00254FCB26|nr:uncharacterized protein LOC130622327 [Hydractinia symbiolongicarpus]
MMLLLLILSMTQCVQTHEKIKRSTDGDIFSPKIFNTCMQKSFNVTLDKTLMCQCTKKYPTLYLTKKKKRLCMDKVNIEADDANCKFKQLRRDESKIQVQSCKKLGPIEHIHIMNTKKWDSYTKKKWNVFFSDHTIIFNNRPRFSGMLIKLKMKCQEDNRSICVLVKFTGELIYQNNLIDKILIREKEEKNVGVKKEDETKENKDIEEKEENTPTKDNQLMVVAIVGAVAFVFILLVAIFVLKKRRRRSSSKQFIDENRESLCMKQDLNKSCVMQPTLRSQLLSNNENENNEEYQVPNVNNNQSSSIIKKHVDYYNTATPNFTSPAMAEIEYARVLSHNNSPSTNENQDLISENNKNNNQKEYDTNYYSTAACAIPTVTDKYAQVHKHTDTVRKVYKQPGEDEAKGPDYYSTAACAIPIITDEYAQVHKHNTEP